MVKAIQKELAIQQHYLVEPVSTIYFGGGTPSLLTGDQIMLILTQIKELFSVTALPEITLEANPDDLTVENLELYRQSGVNRLSIGIQSFQQPVLEWMNRAHNSEQAWQSIELAKTAGFENLNLDLIYGIPLESYSFGYDLQQALKNDPDHISAYNLTIEPGTLFGHQLAKGLLVEADEDVAAEHFQLAMKILSSAGYQHYEISNFCLPGKQSKHNLAYWNAVPYLGIGPSAHSYNGQSRQFNIANNARYLNSLQQGQIPYSHEKLDPRQKINESIMLGIRTNKGVPLQLNVDDFHWDLQTQYPDYLQQLLVKELAVIVKNRLLLTDKGKLLADSIAEDLFVEI